MARLTTAQRNALPASDFAGPNRTYPVNDASHARNAKARAAQFASPALKAKIAKKVQSKYPKIGKSNDRVRAIQSLEEKREGESPNMPVAGRKITPGVIEPRSIGSDQPAGMAPALRGGHPLADPRKLGSGNRQHGSVPAPRGGGGIADPRSLGA